MIGALSSQEEAAAAIDWQLGGVHSHPASGVNQKHVQGQLDAKINEKLTMASLDMLSSHDDAPLKVSIDGQEKGASAAVEEVIYEEARKLTDLSDEMIQLKNKYENDLMVEYQQSNMNQDKIEGLVQDYMQLRLNDCLIKKDFASAMNTDNKHVYMKVLRERIFEELKLTEEANAGEELDWMQQPYFVNKVGRLDLHYKPEHA